MMKRRMLSWLMVLAMLCTLVPTAFAARRNADEMDIKIKNAEADDDDTYYFDEVYDKIADELGYEDTKREYFAMFFDEDDETDLCYDDDEDPEDGIDLYYADDLYLDVDPDDDQWEGSYEVYDYDYDDGDDPVLTGDIIIYFDGRSGDYDVELTWAYDDDYYFDDDDTEEGVSVYEAIDDILDDELTDRAWKAIDWDNVVYDFSADRGSDDVADLEQDKRDEWYLSINDTGVWTGKWTVYEDTNEDGKYDRSEELLSGDISIEITTGASSGGDIIYTATVDDDVTLDVEDFEEFWEDEYSKGTLEYVIFGSVSSRQGELVDEDGEKLSSKDECYVDPAGRRLTWAA